MWMTNNKVIVLLDKGVGVVLPKKLIDLQLRRVSADIRTQLFFGVALLAELCWMEWLAQPSWLLALLVIAAALSLFTGLFGWKYINKITKYRVLAQLHQFMEKHYGDPKDGNRGSFFTRIK